MKSILILSLIFITFQSLGQTKNDKKILKRLDSISDVYQAVDFVANNPERNAEIEYLSSDKDSLAISKTLLSKKTGCIVTIGENIYKLISSETIYSYRVSYIYLDGNKMNQVQVDSLRNIILEKYENGESFFDLANKYTMDGNTKGGDLGWFKSKDMVKEFEDAVKEAKTGTVFKLDIPKLKWHYLVKKTHDNKEEKKVVALKIKSGN